MSVTSLIGTQFHTRDEERERERESAQKSGLHESQVIKAPSPQTRAQDPFDFRISKYSLWLPKNLPAMNNPEPCRGNVSLGSLPCCWQWWHSRGEHCGNRHKHSTSKVWSASTKCRARKCFKNNATIMCKQLKERFLTEEANYCTFQSRKTLYLSRPLNHHSHTLSASIEIDTVSSFFPR